jgi:radical SAM protein with 4Fe4S-binding SPASM domain
VEPERFASFLAAYLDAADGNPALGLKDNFFNLLLTERGRPLTGGCTGFGCGAAFNFVAVLPDGEVHACRKFPSPIGDLRAQSLGRHLPRREPAGATARAAAACRDCDLRPVCRGCAAVTHGFGSDVFNERDPYCFRDLAHPLPPLRIG